MDADFCAYATKQFTDSIDRYIKDVEALSAEEMGRSWGKGSRSAFDFSYEVGWLNRRIATRFRGEDPGPIPTKFGEEWLEAPEELRTKEALAQYLRTTADELIAVIPEGLDKVIKVAENKTPAYQMLLFASLHTSYHDAQLNYIQSMSGDMTVHW